MAPLTSKIEEHAAAGAATGDRGFIKPAYFPVGDTKTLARWRQRIEGDRRFVATLRRAIVRGAPLFRPEREVAAWRRRLAELLIQS